MELCNALFQEMSIFVPQRGFEIPDTGRFLKGEKCGQNL